ncbi:MAG: tRNA (adenosine(37)-N6)-dimethylallyltransferase MiaA [Pseudomonadota bacterium]
MNNLPVIFLMGPTAAGKTDLAISLCEHLNTEIISVDSALVYKDMDIGTAKPNAEELARAPHHLIDIIDPAESYSVADFRRDAIEKIDLFHKQGKVPVLVGGTMMYFKSLIDGLSPLPEASPEVRAELEKEAKQFGWPHLHKELVKIDPDAAKKMSENDRKYKEAQAAFVFAAQSLFYLLYDTLLMLDQGFENEVSSLYKRKDLHPDLPSIRCVGYRQMWDYIAGEIDYDEMVFRGIAATRQLAKRQLTWLRGWPEVTWLTTGDEENLQRVVSSLS